MVSPVLSVSADSDDIRESSLANRYVRPKTSFTVMLFSVQPFYCSCKNLCSLYVCSFISSDSFEQPDKKADIDISISIKTEIL